MMPLHVQKPFAQCTGDTYLLSHSMVHLQDNAACTHQRLVSSADALKCCYMLLHGFICCYMLLTSPAETSVFANQLKDEGFCVVALNPGWVNTDMGGANARKLGMEKAPMDTETSITMQLKVLQGLTTKSNGQFLSYDNKHIDD